MRTAMTPIAESPAGTPRQSVATRISEIALIGKVDRVGDFCLVVITIVLIGWGMQTLKSLLIPFTLAALLTIVAGPAVDAITQKRRIGKRLRTFFCRCHLVAVRRLQAKLLERGYRVGDDVDDGVEEDTSVATPGASPRSDGVEDDSSYSADSESELMRAAAADSARGISWDSQPAVSAMQQRGAPCRQGTSAVDDTRRLVHMAVRSVGTLVIKNFRVLICVNSEGQQQIDR